MNTMEEQIQRLEAETTFLRQERQQTLDALQMAARIGWRHSRCRVAYSPADILKEAAAILKALIPFKATAFFHVAPADNSFSCSYCDVPEYEAFFNDEVHQMICDHTFARILISHQPVVVTDRHHTYRMILNPLATPSRIRGMFIGIPDTAVSDIADTRFYMIPIVLMVYASVVESIETYAYLSTVSPKDQELEVRS